jgi:hypothetical protein
MKKICRLLALFTAFVVVCLSATGCNAIDKMRDSQAFYNKGGSITLRNTQYFLLPENELFSPFNEDENTIISITEPDVPVLLSAVWGEDSTLFNDGEILAVEFGQAYYCREDKYEQYSTLLTAPFEPTGYCYTYYVLDVEDTLMYIEHNYKLTVEQVSAVDEVLDKVEPTVRAKNATYHSDYAQALFACDDTMLLREDSVTIEKTADNYYLVKYNDDGDRGDLEYAVPSEYTAIFDSIVKQAVDAQKIEEEYYGELYDYDEDEYKFDYEVV